MRRTTPAPADATRILLWVEVTVLLVGLLALMLWVQEVAPPTGLSDEMGALVWVVIATVVGAAAVLAFAARQVRLGRTVGWVLALLAQVAVASLPAHAAVLGVGYGAGAAVPAVVALVVSIRLLTDLLRFSQRRGARPR